MTKSSDLVNFSLGAPGFKSGHSWIRWLRFNDARSLVLSLLMDCDFLMSLSKLQMLVMVSDKMVVGWIFCLQVVTLAMREIQLEWRSSQVWRGREKDGVDCVWLWPVGSRLCRLFWGG